MKINNKSYGLLAVLALIWGSSFILMKEGLKIYSPFQLAAFRISLAGLVLLPFINWRKVKVNPKDLPMLGLSGLLGNGLPAFFFATAQTKVSSSLSGALNSLTPLFVLLAGVFIIGLKLNRYKLIGVLIGLSGAIMLFLSNGLDITDESTSYIKYIIYAAMCYGINVNLIKYKLGHYKPIIVASIPLAIISVFTILVLTFVGFPEGGIGGENLRSTASIIVLAVLGTALSLIWFNRLIQDTNAVFASSVTYLIPIVALFWGVLDGESVSWLQISGMLTVLFAIRVINKG